MSEKIIHVQETVDGVVLREYDLEKPVDRQKVKVAFKDLFAWTPESVDLEKISKINYPVKSFGKVFQIGDDSQPFFSEAYLYNLLGKEDARTLLALMRILCKTFEYDTDI